MPRFTALEPVPSTHFIPLLRNFLDSLAQWADNVLCFMWHSTEVSAATAAMAQHFSVNLSGKLARKLSICLAAVA